MRLDPTVFGNAVARLREAMAVYARDPSQTLIRDGLIQRFEFTYELSHKMLKRALAAASPSPEKFDRMPFADLIRAGSAQGMLRSDWARWRQFREMRARTSHTCDEAIALEVVAGIGDFLDEAEYLRDRLRDVEA